MTWLLVEDDNDIRNVVSVMISVWGEKPLPFPDGNAASTWLDSVDKGTFAGELPDLALMDIRMPGPWGDKIAARIRQTSPIKDIPIILMTAFALTETEIRAMMDETGIDLLINKPLPDMDDFRAALYRIRDERRAMNAARLARSQAMPSPAASSQPASSQPASSQPSPAAQSTASPAPVSTPAAPAAVTPLAAPPTVSPAPTPAPVAPPVTTPPAQPAQSAPTPGTPPSTPPSTPPQSAPPLQAVPSSQPVAPLPAKESPPQKEDKAE